MKLKRLNARGFSHDTLLIVFVVVFAIGGVGYLVASKANSCSSMSRARCKTPTSGASSVKTAVRCTITGVSSRPKAGTVLEPKVTFHNTAKKNYTLQGNASISTLGEKSADANKGGPLGEVVIEAKQKLTVQTGLRYEVGHSSPQARKVWFGVHSDPGTPKFSCSKSITLPK